MVEVERKRSQSELNINATLCTKISRLLTLSIPVIFSSLALPLIEVISLLMMRGLSTTDLGGLGLGLMTSKYLGSWFLLAFITGFDTVGAQSFGKKEYNMVGIYMYRCMIIIEFMAIPVYFIKFFYKDILLLLGSSYEISQIATEFAEKMFPSTIFFVPFMLINRFLIVQRITIPQIYVGCICCVLHALWMYVFCFLLDLGYSGTAYAYLLTYFLNSVGLFLYCILNENCRKTFSFPDSNVFRGWPALLKIIIPSGLMANSDFISYFFVCAFSGYLDVVSLAVHQILCNIHFLNFYSIPLGFGNATCTLVGNSLGKGNVNEAKSQATLSIIFSIFCVGTLLLLEIFFSDLISSYYSTDSEVISLFSLSIYIFSLSDFFDSIQAIAGRILCAMTRQPFASVVNFVTYIGYLVPIAYLMVFKWNWGVVGIWFSLSTAYAISSIFFCLKIVLEDWESVSQEAINNIENDKENLLF